jgi:ankyrin repeat protein
MALSNKTFFLVFASVFMSMCMMSAHWANTQVLLQARADVNNKDAEGQTPLSRASGAGRVDVVTELMQAGADLSSTDNKVNASVP